MTDPASFETAEDRTLHWTLSLYVRPEKLWHTRIAHEDDRRPAIGGAFEPGRVARLQLREGVSRALRNAVEPLFNDIADRESQIGASDFLLAVAAQAAAGVEDAVAARAHAALTFHPPAEVSWRTEGREFLASPRGLDTPRAARLRRFWFVHNNGALSWHVGITLGYDYTPADYLFLAMLQKLAAPKEFALDPALLGAFATTDDAGVSVFEDRETGIAPLDDLRVSLDGGPPQRFWPLLKTLFDRDAADLLPRLAQAHRREARTAEAGDLLDPVGLVEVPGLTMPRCRTMMFFNDKRFFKRLAPTSDDTGQRIPRRKLVQDDCYQPYAARIGELIAQADRDGSNRVRLDQDGFWSWVEQRPEYAGVTAVQEAKICAGTFRLDGETWDIPSFDRQRTDCLDYLFLAGFNQNIIDFMNQDPSEILDGTDPIYPASDTQQDEGFFVRFANHRSMITYAPRSRSLEVGNDYIGTCPYAFLIHALSLHNEFLARDFERSTQAELDRIARLLEGKVSGDGYQALARRINDLKIARYRNFEQHRHINVFRYDTERDVFAELEQLRGVDRKTAALDLALASLEDHTDDLESHRSSERDRNLGAIGFVLGGLAIADAFTKLAEFVARRVPWPGGSESLAAVLSWISAALMAALVGVAVATTITRWSAIKQLFERRAPRGPKTRRQSRE